MFMAVLYGKAVRDASLGPALPRATPNGKPRVPGETSEHAVYQSAAGDDVVIVIQREWNNGLYVN